MEFLPSHKKYNSLLINKLEKVCLSNVLNKRFHIPFQEVFYNLETYDYTPENMYHIIIPTTSISKLSVDYLKHFKENHGNVILYALVTDSMHASSPHMDFVRDKLFSGVWDSVLTYDKYDAAEYGFDWFGYTYYSSYNFVKPDNAVSDIYYVGYDKGGRNQIVTDVYKLVLSRGGVARFDVVSPNTQKNECGLKYLKSKISYPQVVSRVKSSNCILEVLQTNQKAQSLRYFEAIAYNKKLLTNNPGIVELPYYDERYMRVFKNIEDIDVDWVKAREKIDYKYKGEFSPLGIIEYIKNNCM